MKKIAINRRHLKRGLGTWTTAGQWFGFPKCCVEAFSRLEHFNENTENWPLYGTGFVPCKKCATTKTAEQLTAEIEAARVSSIPFPHAGGGDYKRETRKENKWILKLLTGRIPFPFEEDVRERLLHEVEELHYDDKVCKANREARLTRIGGQTARQNLIMIKHRQKFVDFWSRVFQLTIPNAAWSMLKGEEEIVDYRVGKTRYVIALASDARAILARAKECGVECKWPEDLQLETRPLHELIGQGYLLEPMPFLDGETIDRINEGHRKFMNAFSEMLLTRQREYVQSLKTDVLTPWALGDQPAFPKAFVIDSLGGLTAEELKGLVPPKGTIEFTFREEPVKPSDFVLGPSFMQRRLNTDVLAKKLTVTKIPVSPIDPTIAVTEESVHPMLKEVPYTPFDKLTAPSKGIFDCTIIGEVADDMILPAGIRHMRGLNFKKED